VPVKTAAGATRARGLFALASLVALTLGAQSCGDKDSLILVALTATTSDATLNSVTIDVPGTEKTFALTGGLNDTLPTTVGVYVPASLTGVVKVLATAKDATGRTCDQGSGSTTISAAGTTISVSIIVDRSKSCASSSGAAGGGGTAGVGGTAGAVGTAGAGTAGAIGTAGTGTAGAIGTAGMTGTAGAMGTAGGTVAGGAPSLTKCKEYYHPTIVSCDATSSSYASVALWDVAFSSDGSFLATAGNDSQIKIWQMTGPEPAQHKVLTTSGQAYIAFSPDGTLFVEGSTQGELNLYDGKTFALMMALTGHTDDIEGVAFTADSKHIWAIDFAGVLTRHDIGGGAAAIASIDTMDQGYTLALSPVMSSTVQWLAVGFEDGTGDLANVSPGMTNPISITVTQDFFGVYGMSFSADGMTMAAGGDDGVVSFWAVPPPADGSSSGATITVPDSMNRKMSINGVRYSPDGNSLAISVGDSLDEFKLGIWDASTRKLRVSTVPDFAPLGMAWSPSGTILVAGEDTCGKFVICSD
jgi:WD40 domain-containing protein